MAWFHSSNPTWFLIQAKTKNIYNFSFNFCGKIFVLSHSPYLPIALHCVLWSPWTRLNIFHSASTIPSTCTLILFCYFLAKTFCPYTLRVRYEIRVLWKNLILAMDCWGFKKNTKNTSIFKIRILKPSTNIFCAQFALSNLFGDYRAWL